MVEWHGHSLTQFAIIALLKRSLCLFIEGECSRAAFNVRASTGVSERKAPQPNYEVSFDWRTESTVSRHRWRPGGAFLSLNFAFIQRRECRLCLYMILGIAQ